MSKVHEIIEAVFADKPVDTFLTIRQISKESAKVNDRKLSDSAIGAALFPAGGPPHFELITPGLAPTGARGARKTTPQRFHSAVITTATHSYTVTFAERGDMIGWIEGSLNNAEPLACNIIREES